MLLIVGEALVAFMRQLGADAGQDLPFSGPWASGAPAIAAYSASMLGAPTHLVAGIGRDAAGDTIRSRLSAAGVTCHESDGGHLRPTAAAYVTYYPDSHREFGFAVSGTAATAVLEADLARLPESASWLHLSGSALLFGEPLAASAMSALRRARAAGATVSVDPNVRTEALTPAAAALLAEALTLAQVIFPSTGEIEALGLSRAELIRGGVTVCSTDGPHGARLETREGTWVIPAESSHPVDTDGAGDNFAGGYIAASMAGATPQEAARAGSRAAAESIAVLGPMEAELTRGPLR
jgi:sugar/nucleoside kinase (ribokinase family)